MPSAIAKVHAAVIAGGVALAGAASLIVGHETDKARTCEKEKAVAVATADPVTAATPCTLPPLSPR
jgi:hypothetical protein